MSARSAIWATVAIAALGVAACKTTEAPAPNSPGEVSAGSPAPATGGGSTGGGTGSSIPTLVSVNLQNVLNDLSVSLNVNRDNIPVTAQVPIAVAASVCGVSVDVIAASAANGHATCNATTSRVVEMKATLSKRTIAAIRRGASASR